jgi:hypothetical protein
MTSTELGDTNHQREQAAHLKKSRENENPANSGGVAKPRRPGYCE